MSDWIPPVLESLAAPVNLVTEVALMKWAQSEGMPTGDNNWLATTLDGYGGWAVNGAGVKHYPTLAAGVGATVATLELGYYTGIVAALRQGTTLAAIYRAINASPWCRGCQGGRYPVALAQAVAAGPGPAPPPPAAIPTGPVTNPTATNAWEQVRHWYATTLGALATGDTWIASAIDLS